MSSWGVCDFAWKRLGPDDSPARKALTHRWLMSVAEHPIFYLEHRLKVFNSLLYFLVPARHCRYAPGCDWLHGADGSFQAQVVGPEQVRSDYLKKNFLVWPVTWLVIGGAFLWFSTRIENIQFSAASRALVLSGLLYLSLMFFVGVATEIRYAYWSIMSVLLAVIVSFDEVRRIFDLRNNLDFLCVSALAVTILAGMIARLTNLTLFVT